MHGNVGAEEFARLSEGRHPANDAQLVKHQPARTYENQYGKQITSSEHRAGWDATFSAPKSVSLTALVGGDDRVREAHRESVRVALQELERYTQARIGNVHAPETTGKFVTATFEHDTARPVDGYPVDFRITLDGTTRAYILSDSILVYVSKSKRTGTVQRGIGLPRNLTPEDSPYDGKTLIHNTEFLPEAETDTNKFYSVRRGEDGYTLYADGQIYYRDIFGDEWVLEIDRYWNTETKTWGPFGSGRFDTHRKAGKRETENPNPN